MPKTILGLDIGGANLKAATSDQRAISVPFALWKQPDQLPAALAELIEKFPGAEELAITMTGELCDCYETKREGVNAILDAVHSASGGKHIRVWSTAGGFIDPEETKQDHLKVASANWHALATFAGRFAPHHGALLLDIGSTTTDIIPLNHGVPSTVGQTDWDRLEMKELVYIGVRRTPVCAVSPDPVCAELFATTQDVYIALGLLPVAPDDRDTADGRPATVPCSRARLARMLGGDLETRSVYHITHFATRVDERIVDAISASARSAYHDARKPPELRTVLVSGQGEFLARRVVDHAFKGGVERIVSLNDELGPTVSACAPAYAVAVLATEMESS